ncbi:MAG TPA: hypothetical protein PLP05_07000 [Sedimentisphaerales bacterium]|nr:hypothetical protein [Sedimentisphaerales bacterium]
MLHDPSHRTQPPVAAAINLSNKDANILRRLAGKVAEIASLPIHKEKALLWTRLNDLKSKRPMVWINEICWNEMNVDDELTLQCEHSWARDQEDQLRKTIYQWKHLPGDMVINDYLVCPLAIHSTDFGILENVDVIRTDETSDVVSRHFNIQIKEPEDIEKIKFPKITHNEKATEFCYQAMCKIYNGIMPVKKQGQTHIWFTPWDYLIRWWGIQEAMMDMILRPDMVNAAVERMVDAWMVELDQFEQLNLLSLDNDNTRVGSGGYGYTSELPMSPYDPNHIMAHNMWGCSNAQIFSEVSPEMHWEFAVRHDLRWLERFGMTYYGCCEPLDKKMDILRKIPNLRKISVSPWCNLERIISEIGSDYVISRKPSPAILAEADWDPTRARAEIHNVLEKADGKCHIEFIMKDISTVRHDPQRLWEWSRIAMEEVENID